MNFSLFIDQSMHSEPSMKWWRHAQGRGSRPRDVTPGRGQQFLDKHRDPEIQCKSFPVSSAFWSFKDIPRHPNIPNHPINHEHPFKHPNLRGFLGSSKHILNIPRRCQRLSKHPKTSQDIPKHLKTFLSIPRHPNIPNDPINDEHPPPQWSQSQWIFRLNGRHLGTFWACWASPASPASYE